MVKNKILAPVLLQNNKEHLKFEKYKKKQIKKLDRQFGREVKNNGNQQKRTGTDFKNLWKDF